MTTLEELVSPALLRALGWTLLHSLWQGALAGAVLAGALLALRRHAAAVRYRAAAGALAALVLLAGLTFGYYYGGAPAALAASSPAVTARVEAAVLRPAAVAALPGPTLAGPRPQPAWLATARHRFDQNLPWLVLAWGLGLLVMSLRLLGGLLYVRRLRRHRARPLPAAWTARLGALAARAGLRRPVALLESGLVAAPLVVGHLRPLVLLPLGAVAGLPVACVEAILAHELAHVLRRDYLVNLLQTLAETVFFYHPAVWYIGQCLRAERENCCDDLATDLVGGDPLRLARALTALAEWSQAAVLAPAPRLALAATGGRGSLLGRVRRLVQAPPARPTLAEGLLAGALLLSGLGLLGGSVALAGPLALRLAGQGPRPAGNTPDRVEKFDNQGVVDGSAPLRRFVAPPDTLPGRDSRTPPATGSDLATDNPAPAPPDAPMPPDGRRGGPGTVVITKDKKGRLVDLVVDGQPVATAPTKPSRAERRAGRQVTVVPLPPTPPDGGFTVVGPGPFERRMGKDFDQKMERKMEKAAKKMEKSTVAYVYTTPASGRRSARERDIHIEIDDAALNRLANDAVALGSVSLNLGLEAAAQGIEEARRSLEQTLRDPHLDATARRATRQALRELERERRQGPGRRGERPEPPEPPQAPEPPEAEERNEAARAHADELRERRQEIQERIRDAESELRELDETRREMPAPPRPPQAPQAPPSRRRRPELPPPPPAPPKAPADNTGKVRAELRRDGLIGPGDHNFSFQLDAKGGRVNGRALTQAQSEKYRRLLLPAAPGKGKSSSTINISVNER